jgi:hypothetical protein
LPKSGAKGINKLFSQFRACSAGLAGILGPRVVRSALTRAEQERRRATMAAAMRKTGLLALATVPFFPPRLGLAVNVRCASLLNSQDSTKTNRNDRFIAKKRPCPNYRDYMKRMGLVGPHCTQTTKPSQTRKSIKITRAAEVLQHRRRP